MTETTGRADAILASARVALVRWEQAPERSAKEWQAAEELGSAFGALDDLAVRTGELPAAWTSRQASDETDPALLASLRSLGDQYGPIGVALAAASLTSRPALIERLESEHETADILADPATMDAIAQGQDGEAYTQTFEADDA